MVFGYLPVFKGITKHIEINKGIAKRSGWDRTVAGGVRHARWKTCSDNCECITGPTDTSAFVVKAKKAARWVNHQRQESKSGQANGLWHVQHFAKLPDDNNDKKAVKYQIARISREFELLQQGLHQLSKTKSFYCPFMERAANVKDQLVAYLKEASASLRNSRVYDPSVSHPSYFTTYVQRHLPEILNYCNCTDPDRLLFHQVHSFVGHRGHAAVLEKYDITAEELGAISHAAVLEKYDMTSEELGAIGWAVGRELAKETFSEIWQGNFSALQKYYAVHGHFQICKKNRPEAVFLGILAAHTPSQRNSKTGKRAKAEPARLPLER